MYEECIIYDNMLSAEWGPELNLGEGSILNKLGATSIVKIGEVRLSDEIRGGLKI